MIFELQELGYRTQWQDHIYFENNKKYPSSEYPFHKLKNVVLSTYRAGYIKNSSPHLKGVIENLLSFSQDGELKYKVNFEKGY